jgi:hypothetical protein
MPDYRRDLYANRAVVLADSGGVGVPPVVLFYKPFEHPSMNVVVFLGPERERQGLYRPNAGPVPCSNGVVAQLLELR